MEKFINLFSASAQKYILSDRLSPHTTIVIAVFILAFMILIINAGSNAAPPIPLTLASDAWITVSLPLILLSGIFLGIVAIFQNRLYRNERDKAASTQVKLREEMLTASSILNGNPHPSAIFDCNFNVIDCNPAMVAFMGMTDKETVIGNHQRILDNMIPAKQRNGRSSIPLQQRLREALATGYLQFETEFICQDKTIAASVAMRAISYRQSHAIVVYMVDLTDLYAAQDRLLYREKLLSSVNKMSELLLNFRFRNIKESLTESINLLVGCIDIDHICIWKNLSRGNTEQRRYAREFEWHSARAAASQEVTLDKERPQITGIPEWENRFLHGQTVNSPFNQLSDNEQKTLRGLNAKSILLIPIFQQGSFWGFVGFDDCRSERVFSNEEETILRSASLLMINAIMRNEMTENIVQARENAMAHNKAKSIFLANMSHEMRTPLNAVVGMTAIGKSAANIERKNYCLEKIENASHHLLGIINDVLDMSKIEAGKLELSPVEYNFEKMLRQVTSVITFKVDQKQQNFTVHIDHNIPERVFGDDQRLSQVLTNLLSNAVKFTPEMGSITLNARLVQEENNRCILLIQVIDTGIGITQEQQSLLFRSFQQADNNTTRKFGGTGLGLVISQRIVELMGGKIWIESEPGRGSTFAFTVEVGRASANNRGLALPAGINRNNIHIMAVDDDENVRAHFAEIMRQFDLSCDLAASGDEALRLREQNGSYNIYFVDWKMPGMDGLELSRRLRAKDSDDAKSIIIMISSVDWDMLAEEARRIGVNKYIPKPLFPSAIADFISECLGVSTLTAIEAGEEHWETYSDRHILLAEDMVINREIVLALLEPTGLRIDQVENGDEAVRHYRADPEKYDLIFMDMQMPLMDGIEATRRIRAFEARRREENGAALREIPIVAMTANVFQEDIDRCLAAGMNDHIGKPLDMVEVRRILHEYMPQPVS